MRITIYIDATFYDDDHKQTHGFRTHVITLSNKEAVDKLVEHFQAGALDDAGLTKSDCLVYDPELD